MYTDNEFISIVNNEYETAKTFGEITFLNNANKRAISLIF